MIHRLIPEGYASLAAFVGILFAFLATIVAISRLGAYLPKDAGRDFAHDGKLSAGKPVRGGHYLCAGLRGGGGAVCSFFHGEWHLSGAGDNLHDDGFSGRCLQEPLGEYKKGFLDLCVAALVAITFLHYNSSVVELAMFGVKFTMPPVVFALLAVVLVWTSVNVTNCSDGVDGLSGTLTIITLMSIYVIDQMKALAGEFSFMILLFAVCILGYLWYNATPSRLLMGDAGSRAMGLFISISILKTGCPFLYIPVALVLILDGGLGLLKVALLRFLKIHILTHVRTPLHDHVRKVWDWSNTQTVFRFAIIQIILAAAVIYAVK